MGRKRPPCLDNPEKRFFEKFKRGWNLSKKNIYRTLGALNRLFSLKHRYFSLLGSLCRKARFFAGLGTLC